MNCERARAAIPQLLDPRPAPGLDPTISAHLAECAACQRALASSRALAKALDSTPEPPPVVRQNFYAMLEEAQRTPDVNASSRRTTRARVATWRRLLSPLAACALLGVGYITGHRVASTPSSLTVGEDTKHELAALRKKVDQQQAQLNTITPIVGYWVLQQQEHPANERLKEVMAAARQAQMNDKVLNDIISALAFDPSVNVRLQAIQTLYLHAERPLVRSAIVAALPREAHPLVQLELIGFVIAAQAREAAPILGRLAEDDKVDDLVRGAARRALAQL